MKKGMAFATGVCIVTIIAGLSGEMTLWWFGTGTLLGMVFESYGKYLIKGWN